MSKKTFLFVSFIAFTLLSYGQKATITEKKVVMKTYMFSDPNPIPDMEKNYPYFKFDGFTNQPTQREWNMVILENDYIKVYINTEVGGKIWGAIEKSTGGEFLYFNDVVKFRDVALRGPWTSGGLEFNFGIMGHTSTGSTPQDYVLKEHSDGSVSCTIGALDLHTNTKWNVEIILQKDKAYFETKSSWYNTANLPVPFYHYSNAAAKADGNLEFIFPGDHYVGHAGEPGTWPNENGKNISFYENNNFGTYKSYHVINSYADYMGGYWHEDNFGFGNLHEYDKMPGKKLWIWGLSDEGMIWEDLLTDTNGQYIEYQTGSSFNQAMVKSSLTPFKHQIFHPYDSNISSELFFPLKGTKGMVAATEHAVLNVVRKNEDSVQIILSALSPINAELFIKYMGREESHPVQLKPLELYSLDVGISVDEPFTIRLGNHLLFYDSEEANLIVDRPILPNNEFEWESAIGYYTRGYEIQKQHAYLKNGATALKTSQELYLKSLALNPAYAPALNKVAFNHYRMMQYETALEHAEKVLSIDTYDPEANYLFGLINAKLGKHPNAKSGFSIASQSTSYRTAAYTELAKLFLNEKKFEKALMNSQKALAYNESNMVALEIQAVAQRLLNAPESHKETLSNIYALDKTSAFVAYENKLSGASDFTPLKSLITNELPEESYIDLALRYKSYGLEKESIDILKNSPKNAKVFLLLAHLDSHNSPQWLNKAIEASPFLIFPYRTEMYEALEELMPLNNHWKLKYYAALVLWKKERTAEAKELFSQCGNAPAYSGFYMAKSKLFKDDPVMAGQALKKAKEIAPNDWRIDLAIIDRHIKDKEYLLAAKIAKQHYAKNRELSIMGMRYASALLKAGKIQKSLNFLKNFEIIPFEGATEGRQIYNEAHLRLALNALKKGNFNTSIEHAQKAKSWPINLGAGKPYNPDERLENSILAHCHDRMGNSKKAEEYTAKVMDHNFDPNNQKNAALYLQFMAVKKSRGESKALAFVQKATATDSTNAYHQWVVAKTKKNSEATKAAETLIKKSPNITQFLLLKDFLNIIKN